MSLTLIINADDLGYDPAVTRGILEAMTTGIVSSTTMMVNGPHSEEAGKQVRGASFGVGLHLNLARWAPVSKVPAGLLGADGGFVEARALSLPPEVVATEVVAQLERLTALTGREASHLDVHKHLHRHPQVLEGVVRAALKRRLPVRSVDPAMRALLTTRGVRTNDAFVGDAGDTAYWTTEQLRSQLEVLPTTGIVELMCHPGYAPSSLKSGYASQREVELKAFTSPASRQWLQARALTPTTWWAVHPKVEQLSTGGQQQ